jgi:hypothetical protein
MARLREAKLAAAIYVALGINLLVPELFLLILAHPVYKM